MYVSNPARAITAIWTPVPNTATAYSSRLLLLLLKMFREILGGDFSNVLASIRVASKLFKASSRLIVPVRIASAKLNIPKYSSMLSKYESARPKINSITDDDPKTLTIDWPSHISHTSTDVDDISSISTFPRPSLARPITDLSHFGRPLTRIAPTIAVIIPNGAMAKIILSVQPIESAMNCFATFSPNKARSGAKSVAKLLLNSSPPSALMSDMCRRTKYNPVSGYRDAILDLMTSVEWVRECRVSGEHWSKHSWEKNLIEQLLQPQSRVSAARHAGLSLVSFTPRRLFSSVIRSLLSRVADSFGAPVAISSQVDNRWKRKVGDISKKENGDMPIQPTNGGLTAAKSCDNWESLRRCEFRDFVTTFHEVRFFFPVSYL